MQAEMGAIRDGLGLAKLRNLDNLLVESDSKIAIELCKSNGSMDWSTYPLWVEITRLTRSFSVVNWKWMRREANRAADCLASLARRRMCLGNWIDCPPSSLVFVLSRDGLPCPHAAS